MCPFDWFFLDFICIATNFIYAVYFFSGRTVCELLDLPDTEKHDIAVTKDQLIFTQSNQKAVTFYELSYWIDTHRVIAQTYLS